MRSTRLVGGLQTCGGFGVGNLNWSLCCGWIQNERCERWGVWVAKNNFFFLTLLRVDECLHLALLFAQNRCLGAREVPKKVGMTHRSLQQCDAMFVCPPNGGQDVCTFGRKLECKCSRSDWLTTVCWNPTVHGVSLAVVARVNGMSFKDTCKLCNLLFNVAPCFSFKLYTFQGCARMLIRWKVNLVLPRQCFFDSFMDSACASTPFFRLQMHPLKHWMREEKQHPCVVF